MDLKRCFKCEAEKPRTEFYRHPEMADGLLGKCKDCTKSDVRSYWSENAEVLRQTDRARRKLRAQIRRAVGNAVRRGDMVKPDKCYYCEAPPASAHHWNYHRPLDVTWLCLRCHAIADAARRDAETKVATYSETQPF